MVWIPGGIFEMGASDKDYKALPHEKPKHTVKIDGFYMDITEVTNAQFSKFVEATAYVTTAERPVDWNLIKLQLPSGTPKPHDSLLKPGSLLFKKAKQSIPNLYDFSQWWRWSIGANWKQPEGSGSSIEGKDNYPVVHISYEDAQTYCDWAGRRLPTEAEWEYAARGGKRDKIYFWGDLSNALSNYVNSWEGEFPVTNTQADGFEKSAPVKSFPPNDFGLYNMSGNVSEWTSSPYYNESYEFNTTFNPDVYMPGNERKVVRGGSWKDIAYFLKVGSRNYEYADSAKSYIGLRLVRDYLGSNSR